MTSIASRRPRDGRGTVRTAGRRSRRSSANGSHTAATGRRRTGVR